MFRNLLASLTLILALSSVRPQTAAAQPTPTDRRTYGATGCHVEAPAEWTSGRVTWTGSCHDGFAEGLGALRNTVHGASPELFLGRVEQGKLRSGVLITAQGYTAGRWEAGSITPPGNDDQANRNSSILAFEDGAKAADAVGRIKAKHANAEARRFYSHLAKRLRSQLD